MPQLLRPESPVESSPHTTANTPLGTTAPPSVESLPPAALAFAARVFDAARRGEIALFEQALPAGLPPNLTNDKGDTLVRSSILLFNDTPP